MVSKKNNTKKPPIKAKGSLSRKAKGILLFAQGLSKLEPLLEGQYDGMLHFHKSFQRYFKASFLEIKKIADAINNNNVEILSKLSSSDISAVSMISTSWLQNEAGIRARDQIHRVYLNPDSLLHMAQRRGLEGVRRSIKELWPQMQKENSVMPLVRWTFENMDQLLVVLDSKSLDAVIRYIDMTSRNFIKTIEIERLKLQSISRKHMARLFEALGQTADEMCAISPDNKEVTKNFMLVFGKKLRRRFGANFEKLIEIEHESIRAGIK